LHFLLNFESKNGTCCSAPISIFSDPAVSIRPFPNNQNSTNAMSKEFDIIIFGATGFTGKFMSEYLCHSKTKYKWAIAGRDKTKLSLFAKTIQNPEIIIASVDDESSIISMCKKTRILINCVGPFEKWGEVVVKSCISEKTHYLDITGEPSFVKTIQHKFNDSAVQNHVLVIPCCGIDSVPADMGCYYTLSHLNGEYKSVDIRCYMNGESMKPSFGTWSTLVHSITNSFSFLYGKKSGSSISSGKKDSKPRKNAPGIHYCDKLGKWAVPLPTSDNLIVYTSAKHNGYLNNAEFVFGNYFLVAGFLQIVYVVIFMLFAFVCVQIPYGSSFLLSLGPKEGGGPSEKERKESKIHWDCYATATDAKGVQTESRSVIKTGEGYEETGKIAAECAFALLEKKIESGGVRTTASVFGDDLIKRLQGAGIEIYSGQSEFTVKK
jgi:short subunit dehydrogenase-like uncharacterized protein